MKIADIRSKTADELKELLISLKKEALNLRFQKAHGELEKTDRIRKVRKDIAKVKTVLSQQLQQSKQGEAVNA
tara:strand:+ start:260 stop:478 length:219 start_codon:yes stop_codon:yes gene_type:complete